MSTADESRRFSELVPFIANGTASADDLRFADAYLQANPERRSELEFVERLRDAMRDDRAEAARDRTAERDALIAQWQSELKHQQRTGTRGRYRNWIRPAFAAAASVVIVMQAALLFQQQKALDEQSSRFRAIEIRDQGKIRLSTAINPEASFAAVAAALREIGCEMVEGPDEAGRVILSCPTKTPEQLLESLRAEPVIDDVSVVDR